MKIGLLGFGVVGRGVYELTWGRDDMQVVKVLRREDMQLPDAKTVRDIRDIVEDDSIDTVDRLFLAVRKGKLRNKAALLFLIFAGGRAPDGAVILHAGSSCPLI